MMENRLGWLLLRWLLYVWRFLVVLVLALGISVGAGSIPAHAYCVGSSLCNPANAPILAELAGTGSAVPTVGAAATGTGSAITSPIASSAATTAAGSSIAAEVWGGISAIALSAAGWLGAKALLAPEELPAAPNAPPEVEIDSFWIKVHTAPNPDVVIGVYQGPDILAEYDRATSILHYSFAGIGDVLTTGYWGSIPTEYRYSRCDSASTQAAYSGNTTSSLENGWDRQVQLPACIDLLEFHTVRTWTATNSPATWGPWIDLLNRPTGGAYTYKLETELNCTGSPVQRFYSDPFTVNPSEGVPLPMRLCPDGEKVTATRIWLRVLENPALDKLLAETIVPDYLQELVPDDCVKAGSDDCTLELKRNGVSIVGNLSEADWETKGGNLQCSYGGVVVDLRFCRAVYGRQPRMSEPVAVTEPVPTTTPFPYPTTAPDFPPLGEPEPPTPGTDEGSCIRWSLSSILSGEVMFQAVGCAMEWAFVPEQATFTATAAIMQASWYTSGPVMFMTEGSGIISATGDSIGSLMSGNCQGPAINLPNYSEPLYLLNACDPPVSTVAGWTHLGSAFVFAFFGLVGALRVVLAAFNIHLPWSKSTAEEGVSA